jgi:hypothetical protein
MSRFLDAIGKVRDHKDEVILQEMPEIAKVQDFDMSSVYTNMKKDLVEVGDFEIYKIMKSDKGEYIHEFLVDSKGKPVLYSSYQHSEGFGIFEKSVYQHNSTVGLARRFYVHYLIPKYNVIISDEQLSEAGFKFYEKLFDSLTIKVLDTTTKQVGSLDSVDEMDEYFTMGSSRYRFMLTKK